MFSRIFFFLVIVCVVNAFVLTVNVFDEDPKDEVASNPKYCNPQACDQLCHRLKFPGGACVNGRCKCDNFLNVEDELEAEVLANPSRCRDRACDWLCRALNYTSGACVNGRCKCTKSVVAEDDLEAEVAAAPSRCRDRACDSVCRALNNTSGACVDGRCKCAKALVAEDDPEAEVAAAPSRCRDRACDLVCRALNNTSGACVDGRCKCTKSLVAEDAATDTDAENSVTSRACNNKRCHQMCRKQKFRGGACVGANCYCNKFLSQQEEIMTDPAESVSRSSCNSIACDDKCRRTGWHSGVCINGQCKCDYFLNTAVAEDLKDSVTPKRCTQQACDNLCRVLGFREGVCTISRCVCKTFFSTPEDAMNDLEESISIDDDFLNDNFFNTEGDVTLAGDRWSWIDGAVSENEDSVTPKRCTQPACNNRCHGLGFRGGVCTPSRCACITFVSTPKDAMNDLEESISIDDDFLNDNFFNTEDAADEYSELDTRRGCRITKCNRTCTRLGYDSATCVNRRCKCYNKTQTQAEISETTLLVSELSEDQNERGCNPRACDQLCRRLKFTGGACVNGRCKCDNFFAAEVDEYSELNTRRGCRITKCNRTCTRLGYDGATCVNRRCKCYNKTRADIFETPFPVSELSEDQNERGCNPRACDQLCRRLKFTGGTCVNGRCKCDNFFGTEDAVDEFSQLDTRRVCEFRKCNRTCTRRGYERARCVNGWCNCYNKIQKEDATPLNEVTSDENEESIEILRTYEEELTDALFRGCNTPFCNEMCHRRGYAGGRCRFGQCRCF